MAASIEKQRASIEQQIKFIKSPVPPSIPASVSFRVPPPVVYACDPVAQPELSRMIDTVVPWPSREWISARPPAWAAKP